MLSEKIMNRPLLYSALFFSLGNILAYYLGVSLLMMIILLSIITVCLIIASIREGNRLLFVITAVFLLGFCLMGWQEIKYKSQYSISNYNGCQKVEVIGEVREDLNSLQGNKIYIKPYYVEKKAVKYGMIQLDRRYIPEVLTNGDIIKIKLSLYQPYKQMNPGGFSNYKYLKRKGVYSQGYCEGNLELIGHFNKLIIGSIIKLKYRLIALLDYTIDRPYNELYKALLLGERDRLPEEWEQNFTLSGVNHLLAISGLHVGFIVLIFLYLLKLLNLPEGIRNFILSLIIILYIILTGFRASVFRAGILSTAFVWAPYFNHKGDVLNILGMTAILNMLINPYQLFSVGFQFSYFVLLMILFWYKILERYITSVFSVSTSALFGATPITAYYFNLITPVAIISNIWAIPLVGMLVSTALIALLLGLIHPMGAILIFKVLIYPTKLLIYGTRLMAAIPYGYFEVATPSVVIMVFTISILIILPFILRKRILPFNENTRRKGLYYVVITILFFIFINVLIPIMNNKLEICFISVGQGDSILLSSPENHHILIDGGGYLAYDSTHGKYTILPYLKHKGIGKLDIVFITHFDADHAAGIIDILGERRVQMLVFPVNFEKNEIAVKIINKAENLNIPVILAGSGDFFQLGGVNLNLLNPPYGLKLTSRNEHSLVIRVNYRNFSLLLTGDLEKGGENRLLKSGYALKSDILKLGHHGSNSSSSNDFFRKVSPKHGIISVGRNNYGHPSGEVLKRAVVNKILIWRTDIQGAIKVKSDGYTYWIDGHVQ